MGAAPRLSRAFPDTGTTPAGPPLRGARVRTRPRAACGARTRGRGRLPRPPAGSRTLRAVQRARRRGGPPGLSPGYPLFRSHARTRPLRPSEGMPRWLLGEADMSSFRAGRAGPPRGPSRPSTPIPCGPRRTSRKRARCPQPAGGTRYGTASRIRPFHRRRTGLEATGEGRARPPGATTVTRLPGEAFAWARLGAEATRLPIGCAA